MSQREYELSKALAIQVHDDDYYALIMAAMRNADTKNQEKLRAAWPEVWEELRARYNAPGGLLPAELEEWSRRHEKEGNKDADLSD